MFYFISYVKTASPTPFPWKIHPLLPSNAPQRIDILPNRNFLKTLLGGSPAQEESEMGVHITLMWQKLGWLNLFWQFLCRRLSIFWSERILLLICFDLKVMWRWEFILHKKTLQIPVYVFNRPYFVHCLSFFPLLATFSVILYSFWYYSILT